LSFSFSTSSRDQQIAQQGERHLRHSFVHVLHLDHRPAGIDDAIPNHRIDLDGHVVPGDRLLLLDIGRHDAQVDRQLAFDKRDEKVQSRPACADKAAKSENNRALILVGDAKTGRQQNKKDDKSRNDGDWREWIAHGGPPLGTMPRSS
jgi:hypothetical protein